MAVPALAPLRYDCAVSACAGRRARVTRSMGRRADVGKAEVDGSADVLDDRVAVPTGCSPEAGTRDNRAVVLRLGLPRHKSR